MAKTETFLVRVAIKSDEFGVTRRDLERQLRDNLTPVYGVREVSFPRPADASIADAIDAFDRECRRGEYTDTDRAWQLLKMARNALRKPINAKFEETTETKDDK